METVRLALHAERLKLTDAWLLHEDALERESLRKMRVVALAFHAIYGVTWGAYGVAGLTEHYAPAVNIAAFTGAALSFTMAGLVLAIDDDLDAARWSELSLALELGLSGGALLGMQLAEVGPYTKGRFFLTSMATQFLAQGVALAILHFTTPKLYISEHYAAYRAHPESDRDEHGLALLVERERRQRIGAYTAFSFELLNAVIYGGAAVLNEDPETRPYLGLIAGTLLLNAALKLIVHLATRTPSENIVLGLPPPADN